MNGDSEGGLQSVERWLVRQILGTDPGLRYLVGRAQESAR